MKAVLALEDGSLFEGRTFAGEGEVRGEVVFNTSMTGYQEILTDPSYKGQIVTLTYPLIGNYGVTEEDAESASIQAEALIVREYQDMPSNWRSERSLADYLNEADILGIEGIDTRALTRRIRMHGAMKGIISTSDHNRESLIRRAMESPGLIGRDLVKRVTCESVYTWKAEEQKRFHVVALDYGIKRNSLRSLAHRGCDLTVVPAHTGADDIRRLDPDGIFLSNGPGDPAAVPYVVDTVRKLVGFRPMFGICLGHQILGQAFGGKTFKLKFGHRGGNQPVQNLLTGKVEITSQNHGFCVDIDSIKDPEVEITHINLNDQTLEGMRHRSLPVFCVQYHPEAAPGPHDASYLFDHFIQLMTEHEKSP
jgi:carbamoyl-phosphate synthase small subunit